jgi:capsular polysaccharide export protein
MSDARWHALRGKRVLLLQGPVGPFFRRLAERLRAAGAEVHKVNFNGGDWLFYPRHALSWRGHPRQWPEFLQSLIERRHIDLVLLFGDCRPIHTAAREVARRLGVRVGAFEEGYIRPNFITFEDSGVNGYSLLPRTPEFYRRLPDSRPQVEVEVGNTFRHAAVWAALYYIASAAARTWFPHYRHHRPLKLSEAWPWLRSAWRKALYRFRERDALERLSGALRGRFFLVPLQVSVDSQVRHHSDFRSVRHFIRHVMASFAAHAPEDALLVIKHHPLGRGYHDHRGLLARLAEEFRITGRVLYIHDQHLPTLLDHARGAVVINSTAGLTAIAHGAPIKVCGVAVYDVPGLTFQGSLDEFWRRAETFRPDRALFRRFRAHLIERTQINGSFYTGSIDICPYTSRLTLLPERPSEETRGTQTPEGSRLVKRMTKRPAPSIDPQSRARAALPMRNALGRTR